MHTLDETPKTQTKSRGTSLQCSCFLSGFQTFPAVTFASESALSHPGRYSAAGSSTFRLGVAQLSRCDLAVAAFRQSAMYPVHPHQTGITMEPSIGSNFSNLNASNFNANTMGITPQKTQDSSQGQSLNASPAVMDKFFMTLIMMLLQQNQNQNQGTGENQGYGKGNGNGNGQQQQDGVSPFTQMLMQIVMQMLQNQGGAGAGTGGNTWLDTNLSSNDSGGDSDGGLGGSLGGSFDNKMFSGISGQA